MPELFIPLKHIDIFRAIVTDFKCNIESEFIAEHEGVNSEHAIVTVTTDIPANFFELGRAYQGMIMERKDLKP